ncbi:hypothetical protein ACTHPF_02360 [Paenibacillus sp. SAF-054]|uniref:hypothetical protein n=1 Tax=unclassified Paenibacillus TaxID=185978 RepID=UPI003F81B3C2
MKKLLWTIAGAAVAVYIIFSPSFTGELAVRKHLLFTFHPIQAFSNAVQEGNIKNDPRYGDLYVVEGMKTPYIYVKKSALGWSVSSKGTGP